MKRIMCVALAALSVVAAPVRAQVGVELHFGGGITQPTGNFKDAAKLGWHGLATIALVPGHAPFAIQGSALYGQNKFEVGSGKWTVLGALAELRLDLSTKGTARGYVMAGGGAINVKAKPTGGSSTGNTKGAFDVGAGFAYMAANEIGVFIEGRYLNVFEPGPDFSMIPITVGVRLVIQ
jgi:hypothetical protein